MTKKKLVSTVMIVCALSLTGCGKADYSMDKAKEYEGKVVCENDYQAYINEKNEVEILDFNGKSEQIRGLSDIVQISGDENILMTLNEKGKIQLYSFDEHKVIDNVADYFAADKYEFELGGTMLAAEKQWNENLTNISRIKQLFCDYDSAKKYFYAKNDSDDIICDGCNWSDEVKNECKKWKDITDFTSNGTDAMSLNDDGTVNITAGIELDNKDEWTDIKDIESGFSFFALKNDGRVISSGYEAECLVSEWTDIVQLSVAVNTTAGLQRDGTVKVACAIDMGQSEAQNWKDIVYVKAAYDYIMGVTKEGKFVSTKKNEIE